MAQIYYENIRKFKFIYEYFRKYFQLVENQYFIKYLIDYVTGK
jgi:hypothetical protein